MLYSDFSFCFVEELSGVMSLASFLSSLFQRRILISERSPGDDRYLIFLQKILELESQTTWLENVRMKMKRIINECCLLLPSFNRNVYTRAAYLSSCSFSQSVSFSRSTSSLFPALTEETFLTYFSLRVVLKFFWFHFP